MTDEYSLLSAVVQPSEVGDFFEVYGQYNNEIYSNFITQLKIIREKKMFFLLRVSFSILKIRMLLLKK